MHVPLNAPSRQELLGCHQLSPGIELAPLSPFSQGFNNFSSFKFAIFHIFWFGLAVTVPADVFWLTAHFAWLVQGVGAGSGHSKVSVPRCDDHCSACEGSSGNCLRCKEGYSLLGGSCVTNETCTNGKWQNCWHSSLVAKMRGLGDSLCHIKLKVLELPGLLGHSWSRLGPGCGGQVAHLALLLDICLLLKHIQAFVFRYSLVLGLILPLTAKLLYSFIKTM